MAPTDPLLAVKGSNTLHTPAEMSRQRDTVKRGLRRELVLGQVWSPIPYGWFHQWKAYVDFDEEYNKPDSPPRPEDMLRALHPGPIDTSPLRGSYGDELKRGMVENRDFVLVPSDVFDLLVKAYELKGMNLGRKVQTRGGTNTSLGTSAANRSTLYVDMYPVRFELFVCKAEEKGKAAGVITGGTHPAINNPYFTTTPPPTPNAALNAAGSAVPTSPAASPATRALAASASPSPTPTPPPPAPPPAIPVCTSSPTS